MNIKNGVPYGATTIVIEGKLCWREVLGSRTAVVDAETGDIVGIEVSGAVAKSKTRRRVVSTR